MRGILALWLTTCLAASAWAADRPNIVWLSIEDASPHLGCYGDSHARTPNLDRFATESILYENAFATAPVCAPSRSAIITGVYATSLGTHNMRSMVKLPPEIRPFTSYLREAGYYCTNNAKEDYQFQAPKGSWDESSRKAHWRKRANKEQPFFAVFNYEGTHESHLRGDEPAYSRAIQSLAPEELHDPNELELPPYYPDTAKVREDWARYYNCMTAMDKWVAGKLKELDDAGVADDTIVFFWSDHGVGLPRGKRWLYDSGIKVPLIVHVPKKWRKLAGEQALKAGGTRTDELVSLIDLPETMLNLAGVAIPTYMQGRAFLGPNLTPEREYIYAGRDRMDERYDMSRCVRTKRYKYIRNYMPWRPYTQWVSYGEQCATMRELRRLKDKGELNEDQLLWMAETKPIVEFYDMEADPHELRNLAERVHDTDSPAAKDTQVGFDICRSGLWETEHATRDVGMLPESFFEDVVRDCGSRYGAFRREWMDQVFGSLYMRRECASSYPEYLPNFLKTINEVFGTHSRVSRVALNVSEVESGFAAENLLEEDIQNRNAIAEAVAEGLPTLLDSMENAESPWDRLQAANVIDLLPNFDAHANEIRPVVVRVRAQLEKQKSQVTRGNADPLGYLERCVERFEDRLGIQ